MNITYSLNYLYIKFSIHGSKTVFYEAYMSLPHFDVIGLTIYMYNAQIPAFLFKSMIYSKSLLNLCWKRANLLSQKDV